MGNNLQPKPLSLAYWLYLPSPGGHEFWCEREDSDSVECLNSVEKQNRKIEPHLHNTRD